jgi:hypothetical protein
MVAALIGFSIHSILAVLPCSCRVATKTGDIYWYEENVPVTDSLF